MTTNTEPKPSTIGHKGASPVKQFRCPDQLWLEAGERAHGGGMSLSEVLRDLLRDYVAGKTMQ